MDEDRTRPEGLTGVLDALEEVVRHARSMPMSSSVLVNRTEVLDLIGQARALLPAQLSRADEVLDEADTVLADAERRAQQVIEEAQARAAHLVSSEQVVLAATERAQQIVAAAEQEAARLRRDADDYCDRRLADFEIDLEAVLGQVRAGRAKLADRLGPAPASPDEAQPRDT